MLSGKRDDDLEVGNKPDCYKIQNKPGKQQLQGCLTIYDYKKNILIAYKQRGTKN